MAKKKAAKEKAPFTEVTTGQEQPKKKGLIDVARWMPQIRRVCSRQIVYDQLDQLEAFAREGIRWKELRDRITQIKKDVARIKL